MTVSDKTNGYDTWSVYTAMKLHFSSGSYNAFKFNFKGPRLKESSFLIRRDRYFFEKLAKKYPKRQTIIHYFLANILAGNKWIGGMSDEVYMTWTSRIQSLLYGFKTDISTLHTLSHGKFDSLFTVDGGQCKLYEAYHRGLVSLETLTTLDFLCGYTSHINKKGFDPMGMLNDTTQQINGYRPFITQVISDKKLFQDIVIKTFTTP